MPRAHLVTSVSNVPLTVTGISVKLGVSPSTLRTWERRYGLGPTDRQAGSRRRYSTADIEALTHMVNLVRSGVSASDAAAVVLAQRSTTYPLSDDIAVPEIRDIVDAAQVRDLQRLEKYLEASIASEGLVRTWSNLIEPALDTILSSEEGQEPGCSPSAMLTLAVLKILAAIADARPDSATSQQESVFVVADSDHALAAHIVGVALNLRGIFTTVMDTQSHGNQKASERLNSHLHTKSPKIIIIMGQGARCERLVSLSLTEGDAHILLVGADSPSVLDSRIQRMRTLTACVEETIALVTTSRQSKQ
ncbi:MAG: helix-turn-helix-type transcriptional regulator [Actinobacteria bacterium]|nr:MAG: helix-turn-helix-type transcriptional regulator [Actinomycetota bacterium]